MQEGVNSFSASDEDEEEEEDELQDAEEGDVRAEFAEVSEGKDEEADNLADMLDNVSLSTT